MLLIVLNKDLPCPEMITTTSFIELSNSFGSITSDGSTSYPISFKRSTKSRNSFE